MSTELRAIEAERILECNRREVAALYLSVATADTREEFPRSAIIRWLFANLNIRAYGPLPGALTSFLARLVFRRLFTRRA